MTKWAKAVNPPGERAAAILDAATGVFLRYGYRKTSMDDLARAAGLSRQGLYLHFRTKEALFDAVVEHLAGSVRETALTALADGGRTVADRLADALAAVHDSPASTGLRELTGELPARLHHDVVAAIADLVRRNGIESRWHEHDVTADELAEHLFTASSGARPDRRREQMAVAVRIVTRGECPQRTV